MVVDKVIINGVNVTSFRLGWNSEELWREAIPTLNLDLSPLISDVMEINTALDVQVYRTLNVEDDDFVFDGEITQVSSKPDKISCVCKGRLIEAIKAAQVKSWDKDIDPELGIGSEIMKTLILDSNLNCTPAQYDTSTVGSVAFTGSDQDKLITKFVQKDEDNVDRMLVLAEQYDHILRYDNYSGLVYFQPKGYSVYPYPLTVGIEIPKPIVWKENKEQLINQVIVSGATVFDTLIETFAGPAMSFNLSKTPQDTEVRVGGSTGTLQVRGQKGVGVLGTNYDYYIDEEAKTLNFATNQSNVYIRYTAQVPCPVVLTDLSSIQIYGGPNKTPSIKKLSFSDIKNLTDAEARGRSYLARYSTPFVEAQGIKVIDLQIRLQVIKPGDLLTIIDTQKDKTYTVFVQAVRKSYPQPQDEIDIGDKIWRTENWQADQMKKINQIFNELNKNQDILTQIFDFNSSVSYEPFYFAAYRTSRAGSTTGVWDSPTLGVWDVNVWGPDTTQFIIGSGLLGILGTNKLGSNVLDEVLEIMIPGNLEFKEYFYSTEFVDSTNTTSTVDTSNFMVKE